MICAYAEWFYGEVEEASTNPELNIFVKVKIIPAGCQAMTDNF